MKKSIITLALVGLLVGVGFGVVVQQYYHPETAFVTTVKIEEYLDGAPVANGTQLDWGAVLPNSSNLWNYTIRNVGSVKCTVYRVVSGLPGGWNETWTGNNTLLEPQDWLVGDLNLTVPANASGTYNWHSYLIAKQT